MISHFGVFINVNLELVHCYHSLTCSSSRFCMFRKNWGKYDLILSTVFLETSLVKGRNEAVAG